MTAENVTAKVTANVTAERVAAENVTVPALRRIEVDGARIRYVRLGEGIPLVYLHSPFGEVGVLPLFTDLAAAGFEVIAPEIPGFGRSDAITTWHGIADVVFTLRRILDSLEVDRAVLVGSSLGGWLAAEIAVWFPERVRALALLSPLGLRVDDAPVFQIFGAEDDVLLPKLLARPQDLVGHLSPALAEDAADPHALPVHLYRALEATARIGWNPHLHNPRLQGRLALIGAPTLVVRGQRDGILPAAHPAAYAASIPSARLVELADCAHLPALERPAEVAGLITALAVKTAT